MRTEIDRTWFFGLHRCRDCHHLIVVLSKGTGDRVRHYCSNVSCVNHGGSEWMTENDTPSFAEQCLAVRSSFERSSPRIPTTASPGWSVDGFAEAIERSAAESNDAVFKLWIRVELRKFAEAARAGVPIR